MSTVAPTAKQMTTFVDGGSSIEGELVVTRDRLRFKGLNPVGVDIDRLLGDLIDVRFNEAEAFLVAEFDDGSNLRWMGGDLSQVANALNAYLFERAPEVRSSEPSGSEDHAVSLRNGPIIHRGTLRLSAGGASYTPRGFLDTLVGIRPQEIAWADLVRVRTRGAPNGVVEISHKDGLTVFQPSAPDILVPALLARLFHWLAASEDDVETHRRAITAAGITPPEEFSSSIDTPMLAIHLTEEHGYRPGVLQVQPDALCFSPFGEPDSTKTLPFGSMIRRGVGRRGLPKLALACDGVSHAFLLPRGVDAAYEFWSRVRAPSRVVSWTGLGTRTKDRLTSQASFTRLQIEDEDPCAVDAITATSLDDSWALTVAGMPPAGAEPGVSVRVELVQDEGVYAFDAVLSSVHSTAHDESGQHQTTLVFEGLSSVRVYNNRSGYRANVVLHGSARPVRPGSHGAAERPALMTTSDISIGGFRAASGAVYAVGDQLAVSLEVGDRPVRAVARVLRADTDSGGSGYVYGIGFDQITISAEDRIHELVLRNQRRGLTGALAEESESDEPPTREVLPTSST